MGLHHPDNPKIAPSLLNASNFPNPTAVLQPTRIFLPLLELKTIYLRDQYNFQVYDLAV